VVERGDVYVGLQMDMAAASRGVDIGPSADSAEAAPFRQFWGERSEMRRFQVLSPLEMWPYFTSLVPPLNGSKMELGQSAGN
jgi:hypothetical protein